MTVSLIWNRFQTLIWCFRFRIWAGKWRLDSFPLPKSTLYQKLHSFSRWILDIYRRQLYNRKYMRNSNLILRNIFVLSSCFRRLLLFETIFKITYYTFFMAVVTRLTHNRWSLLVSSQSDIWFVLPWVKLHAVKFSV